MTTPDRRRFPRVRSLNLLSYVCVDENNTSMQQGMGRTLDVSEGGILLETHVPIDSCYTVCLTLGLGDDLADIQGKVAFSRKGQSGRIENGIEFQEGDQARRRIVDEYVRAFTEQKKK